MGLIFHDNFVIHVLKHSEPRNILFSPESSFSLFQATLEGFDELTQQFLLEYFDFRDDKFSKSFDLYDHKLINKTKISIRKEVNLPNELKNTFDNKFGCTVEEFVAIYSDSSKSFKKWINEIMGKTQCKILMRPNINNTTYCNFKWHEDVQVNTSNKTFHNDNDMVDGEFIEINGELGYVEDEDLNSKIIEIPLANENLTTFLILPNNKHVFKDLEFRLSSYGLQETIQKIKRYKMKVSLPKFKVKHVLNLKDLFYKMDDTQIPYKFGRTESCHVGKIRTVAFMEVSTTDIKAAAVTGCELLLDPLIKEMIFETSITNRFAKTLITSKMENLEGVSQKTTFSVALPENAFISQLMMEISGKSYKSYVEEKNKAKYICNKALTSKINAADIAVIARDSNFFTITVNLEPHTEIIFVLTYEELLQRRYDQYELVLNIQPGKLINVLKCIVKIDESTKLKFIKTPAIRSGYEVIENEEPNLLSTVEISDTMGLINFEPDRESQKQIAQKLGFDVNKGISGQFVVQYDLELDYTNGEILINDGYFVHFYAPDDLPPLPTHVIFALDTSGSMRGRKIDQLKDAMKCILDQIKLNDLIDILEFTTKVNVHYIDSQVVIVINYDDDDNYHEPFNKYECINFPTAIPLKREIIEKAKKLVDRIEASESTHAIGGLETALFLVKRGQERYSNYQPLIIFLTDGMPNAGIGDTNEISRIVTKLNHKNNRAPIFSLSFGEGADKKFLKKLSLANFGFNRHIYEAADASLQLQRFYKQISSPVLSDITFTYDFNVEDATRTIFPIYFKGSDIVVCGRYADTDVPNTVNVCHREGRISLKPIVKKSVTQIERLWAYLTLKQLLEQRENAEGKVKTKLTKQALDLAVTYSFVTELTSLVVIRAKNAAAINTKSISDKVREMQFVGPPMTLQTAPMYGFSIDPRKTQVENQDLGTEDVELSKQFVESVPENLETTPKPPLPTEFVADQPFLIMIQYKMEHKQVILFLGKISEPF